MIILLCGKKVIISVFLIKHHDFSDLTHKLALGSCFRALYLAIEIECRSTKLAGGQPYFSNKKNFVNLKR